MRAAIDERVIEVVAQFDGAVIEVRHLRTPPAEGEARAATVRVAVGAAALAGAVGLFVFAYFAQRAGAWVDVAAAIALAGGGWALVDGLLRRAEAKRPSSFELPRGLVDGGEGRFPLVRSNGHGWELTVAPAMETEVERAGAKQSFDAASLPSLVEPGARALLLDATTRAWVRLGALTFHVSSVAPADRQPPGPLVDWQAQSYTASCALAAAVFLALMFSMPPDPKSLALDELLVHQRYPTFILKPPADEPVPILNAQGKPGHDDAGGRAKGASGAMGSEKSTASNKRYRIAGPRNNHDLVIGKEMAENRAAQAFHDLFGNRETSSIGAIWSTHESALGDAEETMHGTMTGLEDGDAYGHSGLGPFGKEKGGGGTGQTIGMSNLPTIGHGGQKGGGGGCYGCLATPWRKKKDEKIEAMGGATTKVIGSLDKEIVKRVVHKHLNEVKFCYEKELLKRPEIAGRVLTQFTIGSNGKVLASAVQASTLADPAAETCIAEAVRRWEFPRPEGGVVIVQYPFVLKFAGN
jgi:hypothetical protein